MTKISNENLQDLLKKRQHLLNMIDATLAPCRNLKLAIPQFLDLKIDLLIPNLDAKLFGNIDNLKLFKGQLSALSRIALPLLKEHKNAELLQRVGIFPHPHLISVLNEECSNTDEIEEGDFINDLDEIWPILNHRLKMNLDECLADNHLFMTYCHLLSAHKTGLYFLSDCATVKIVERAMNLVAPEEHRNSPKLTKKINQFYKRKEFDEIPIRQMGGLPGYKVLKYICDSYSEQTTKYDEKLSFPNRHASAHGKISKDLTIIDSLNCVLLSHWVIYTTGLLNSYKN